jgi:DNA helicase-2/ATP-dependent DNA helicase PcrA
MDEAKSRFDEQPVFSGSTYSSPGWKRAQERSAGWANTRGPAGRQVIEGEGRLIATSDPTAGSGRYRLGDRVFHIKYGYGEVTLVEGSKLTVAFDKAGEKRVIDSFLERA